MDKTIGVALEGTARDDDDAMLAPAMQTRGADAEVEAERIEKFDLHE
ncbi:MAG TPA: hypothetical protein VJ733_04510 [Candidatus Binatia bacterium]|nr:hypothetical protein [Candidatus Binatia bacterium]